MKRFLPGLFLLALVLSACSNQEQDALVVYSGRSEVLVDNLVERFEAQTGIPVEVRYGTDAQLLAALQEEGDRSPADIFWANTVGALSAASNAGLLTTLPDTLLAHAEAFVPSGKQWVPVTTRFRVLAYNADRVNPEELPTSVLDLPSLTQYKGRIGWTPAYSSFQDFVTALRVVQGEDSARAWLEGMKALEPRAYASNTPMLQALAAGEIDLALTNHYYVLRLTQGAGDEAAEGEEEEAANAAVPVSTYYFASGDVGNLALVTGAGLLNTSDQPDVAGQFLRFLLSPEAQQFAAEEVQEYPVTTVDGLPSYMLPVGQAVALSPSFDFERLRDLDATLALLREAGLL